jgi:pseudouridine-5'-phosphate glycosidase
MIDISEHLLFAAEISNALENGRPIVALESTVITHGLPFPENLQIAKRMEEDVRNLDVLPATIAILDGKIHIGINYLQLERLAKGKGLHKISRRDYGPALAFGWSGGTTVAGTMLAADAVGIPVFATGGIGGVHRSPSYDISADLLELSRTPLIVVCAGAKAILDLKATLEYLETASVPVVGYQTDEFPAFYSRGSGSPVSARADSPEQIVAIARAHWAMGNRSAVLVVNPLPEKYSLPYGEIEVAVMNAINDADAMGVSGQAVTPFLLSRVSEFTSGASLQANLDLLRANAILGAKICKLWYQKKTV